jgi:hypothetical protein
MNSHQEISMVSYHPPLKESRVHLDIEEEEIDMIRKKNHTFGMKEISARSSRQQ